MVTYIKPRPILKLIILKHKIGFLCTNFNFVNRMHINCINGSYPKSKPEVFRAFVPEGKIEWNTKYEDYLPVVYTAPSIKLCPSFADPEIDDPNFKPKWNELDGDINRKSHENKYKLCYGYPLNYNGRTGIQGRGLLGRWGPNHAADPVVTRWKIDKNKQFVLNEDTGKKILQFVSIKRRDCGLWAIPGGMVDPGEKVTITLMREFMEEALNSHEMTDSQKLEAKQELLKFFEAGKEIYAGYVDDPRNTDNAWMETVAYNFHENSLDGIMYKMKLTAGDDAQEVKWYSISKDIPLYATHGDILKKVVKDLDAHW